MRQDDQQINHHICLKLLLNMTFLTWNYYLVITPSTYSSFKNLPFSYILISHSLNFKTLLRHWYRTLHFKEINIALKMAKTIQTFQHPQGHSRRLEKLLTLTSVGPCGLISNLSCVRKQRNKIFKSLQNPIVRKTRPNILTTEDTCNASRRSSRHSKISDGTEPSSTALRSKMNLYIHTEKIL